MKNLIKNLIVLLLAAAMLAGVFSACGDGKAVKELIVENARISFKTGDDFEYGDGFVVWAVYADGSKKDVTAAAEIKKESGFDMNVVGDYQITVRYGGRLTSYNVYVNEFDDILRKIEIDSTDVKKTYALGEKISFAGLKLKCTYENAQGILFDEIVTSLSDFVVDVADANGKSSKDGTLTAMGEYVVTVSRGAVKDAYKVSVNSVDVSTVANAIIAGRAFVGEVVSGRERVYASLLGNAQYDELDYEYEFGKDYIYIRENLDDPVNEYHVGKEGDKFLAVRLAGGQIVASSDISADMLSGAPFALWYSSLTAYGVENALKTLYEHALVATNRDIAVKQDETLREYEFSYSGLENASGGSAYDDYYETKVKFKLGEKYNVESAEIIQEYWENNEGYKGAENYQPSFITDLSTGKTVPNKTYSKRIVISVTQQVGVRTKKNPYSNDGLTVTSFKLQYGDKDLGNNGVIETDMSQRTLTVKISDVQPATADLKYDAVKLSLVGSHSPESDSVYEKGLFAYIDGNSLFCRFEHGGEWQLIIRTANVSKTLKITVIGIPPTSIEANVFNPSSATFYAESSVSAIVGSSINFLGKVNDYANAAQTATVTSANKAYATISADVSGGVNCFAFSATQEGKYVVEIRSDAANNVSCTLTFNIIAKPNLENLFNGNFSAKDNAGNEYTVKLTPANIGGINGTAVITFAPANSNGGGAQSQTFSYSVNEDTCEVVMTAVSGEDLGVLLGVGSLGQLVIEDRYGYRFDLVKQ